MVQHAAVLMRSRGVTATSVAHVVAESGAPRGSVAYYFPRGKAQLIEEATSHAGEYVAGQLTELIERHDPADAVSAFAVLYRELLLDTDYADGCPVLAAALEGERNPGARDAAGAAFTAWAALFADAMTRRGVPVRRARTLGSLIVTSLEGAIGVARAQRSTSPLDDTARELHRLIDAAVKHHSE